MYQFGFILFWRACGTPNAAPTRRQLLVRRLNLRVRAAYGGPQTLHIIRRPFTHAASAYPLLPVVPQHLYSFIISDF